jgi:hypothetical protein
MPLTRTDRRNKLRKLAESEGYESVDDLLCDAAYDSVVPGICTRPDCSYTCDSEPDARKTFARSAAGRPYKAASFWLA